MKEIQNWFIQNFKNEGVNEENVSEFMNIVKSMRDELGYILKIKTNPSYGLDEEGYYKGVKSIEGGLSIKAGTKVNITCGLLPGVYETKIIANEKQGIKNSEII